MSGRHKRAAVSPSRRVADVSGKNLSKVSQMAGFKVHSGVAAIVADDNNLSTLAGIAQYSSLVQLSVRASSLVRMAEVASLPCLVTLNLQHNSITEIAGLGGLVNLQWLCLAGNSIKEMSGLSRNVQLSHLDLSDNCISHLADLSILPQLKTVLLHGNAISTLRRLPQCLPQSVETLTMAENEVADLNEVSFLAALQSLTQLSVMSNPCVTLADSTVLFDYRPYVLYWCPTLSTLDGVGVTAQERQQAASLFPPSHGCPFSLGQHSALVAHLSSSSSSALPLSHLLLWPPQQPLPLSEQSTSEPSPAPLQPASPQEQAEFSKKLKALQLLQEMIEAQEELLLNASQSEGEPQPTGGGEGRAIDATAASLPAMQGLDALSLQVAAAQDLDGQARRGGSQEWQEKQKRKEEERAERGEGNRGDSGKLSRLEGDKSLQERRKEQLKLINQKIAANKKHSSTVPSHNSAPSVATAASFGWEGSPLIARSKTDSQMTKQSGRDQARDSSISPSLNANPCTANDTSFFDTTATLPSDALESTSYYLPIEDSDTILTSAITDYEDGDETLLDISSLASSITQAYGISNAGERSQLLSALVGVRGEQFDSWSREMALHSEQGRRAERDTELKQAPITATTASLVSPSRNGNVRYPSSNSATKRPITSSNESPSAIASYQPPQAPIDSSVPPPPSPPSPPSAIANQQKGTPQQSPNPGLAAVKTHAAAAAAVVVVVAEKQLSPEAAAVKIQALVRGFLTRRIIKLYLARVRAATTIQAAWRGYVARLRDPVVLEVRGQLSRAKLEAYVASLCLQLQGCRQELAHQVHMTQLQEEALHTMLTEVAALQSWRAGLEEEGRRKAAIVIQKHWKGYRVRKCHSFPSSSSSPPPPPHHSSQALWALCTSLQQQVQQLQSVLGLVVEDEEEEGEGVEGCGQLRQRYQRMGFLSPPPHQLHTETPAPISSHYLPVPQGLQMSHHSDSCVLLRWLPVTLPSPLTPPPSSPLLPPPTSSPPPPAAAAAAGPVLQGYSVLVNGTAEGQIAPDKTKAYIEGLDHTATYRVTVRAIFDTGESNDSNAVMASLTALCRDKQAEAHRDSPTNSKSSSSSSSSHDTHTNSPDKDEEKSTTSALPDEKILTPAFSEVAQMKEIEAPVVESSDSEAGGTTASQKPSEGNGDSLGSEFSHTTADEEGDNYEVAQVVKTDYEQTSQVDTLTLSDVEAINKPPQSVTEEEEEQNESGTSNHPEVDSENALAQQAADPPATTSKSYSTAVTLSQEEAATVSGLALSTTALPQQTTALQPLEAHPVFEHSRAFDDVSSSGSLTTQHMPTLMLYLSGEQGPTHNATSTSASRLEGTTTMQNIGTSGQPLRQDLAYFSDYNPAINTTVAAGVTVQLTKEHGKLVPLTVEGHSQSFEQNSQDPVTKQDNQTIDITPYTVTSISSTSVVTSSALIGPSATTSTDSSANKCGLLSDQLPNSNPSLKGPDKSIVAFSSAAETTEKVEVSQAGWNQTQAQGSCSMPTEEALQQEATTVAHTLLTCAASPTTEFVGCNGQQLGSYAGSDPAPGPNTVGEGAVTTVDGGAPTGDTGPTFVTSDPVGIAPKDEPFEDGRGGESATTGVSGGGHFEKAVVSTAEALLSQLESELRTSASSQC